MTDLQTRITNANPAAEADFDDDGLPSFDAIWLAARRTPIAARHRSQARFVRTVVATQRGWVAVAGTAGAVVVAALVLSAGTAPSVAQAFPILNERATDLRSTLGSQPSVTASLGNWLPAAVVPAALQNAHEFSIADGTGYVIESPDTTTLCLLAKSSVGPATLVGWAAACSPTTYAEQNGMIASVDFVPGQYDFYALVPAGGSVHLTDDGSTTTVPINDGIASGVVHDSATVTLQVGGSTQTRQIPQARMQANDVNGGATPAAGTSAARLRRASGLVAASRHAQRGNQSRR